MDKLNAQLLPDEIPLHLQAKWIWLKDFEKSVDCYVIFRKKFIFNDKKNHATLSISASSYYQVTINGEIVGSGPNPSNSGYFYVDSYDIAEYLNPGENIIAVLGYNTYLGLHSCPRRTAGIVAQIQSDDQIFLSTDETWKALAPECWSTRAPRLYWTIGFSEYFDFNKYPDSWEEISFDDSAWSKAVTNEVLMDQQLIPSEIPPLNQTLVGSNKILHRGNACLPTGLQVLSLNSHTLRNNTQWQFSSFVYIPEDTPLKGLIEVTCDDEFILEIENKQILRQYNDQTFFNGMWEEKNDAHSFHHGHGRINNKTTPRLFNPGWNKISLTIIACSKSWGAELKIRDHQSEAIIPLLFSSTKELSTPSWRLKELDTKKTHIYATEDFEQQSLAHSLQTSGHIERKEQQLPIELSPGNFCVLDFHQQIVGHPQIELESTGVGIIDLSYGERIAGDGQAAIAIPNYADRLILKTGENSWKSPHRKSFRYLQLTYRSGEKAIIINKSAVLTTTSAPDDTSGEFNCSDQLLNEIHQVTKHTLKCCMQDHFVDCPTREWGQYPGDSMVEALQAFYIFGDSSLSEKGLRQFARIHNNNGYLRALCPAGTDHNYIDYSMAWVQWLYEHYWYNGDKKLLTILLPNIKKLFAWFEKTFAHNSGLLEFYDNNGLFRLFLDHSPLEKSGVVTGLNAWYFKVLNSAAFLAGEIGDRKFAKECLKRSQKINQLVNQLLWNEKEKCFADCRDNQGLSPSITQATNILALYSGIVSPTRNSMLLNKFFNNDGKELSRPKLMENPYFKYYLLKVLFSQGKTDWATCLIKEYWGKMVELGATTWWEVFDGSSIPEQASLCHAWSGAPGVFLLTDILGVTPAKPGFSEIFFKPNLGEMSWISGTIPTPLGDIKVECDSTKDKPEYNIILPEKIKIKH